MSLPTVATLWIGPALSWIEQLCLRSFVDHGHPVVLYAYEPVANVPEGIRTADANAVFPKTDYIRHARSGSPAVHADAFRYRLLDREDVIWIDADILAMRPWDLPEGHVFGWEKPGKLVCNAVLRLTPGSPTLAALNALCSDEYPVPPWAKPDERARLEAARDAGAPVHVSLLPWGVWGPAALTWFLTQTGEIAAARPQHAFYPVAFRDRRRLIRGDADLAAELPDDCLGVHLWNRRLRRRLVEHHGGLPDPGSLLDTALRRHGIEPEAAPIPDERPQDDTATAVMAEAARHRPPPIRRTAFRQSPRVMAAIARIEADGDAAFGRLPPPETPPDPGRVLVVTSMKNEGPFILEWIAYHRAIGVTDFLVYTNDCADPTNAILDRLATRGIVTRIDNPYDRAAGEKPQHAALKDAVRRPVYARADWVLVIDVDEFLNIHVGEGTIADFLAAANGPNVASFTWKFFGNAGVTEFDDRPVIEQFTRCAPEVLPKSRLLGWGFKSMVAKSAPYRRIGVHRPLEPDTERLGEVRWVNGSGRVMPESVLTRGWRSTRPSLGYRFATLNHYVLRSAESFLVKRERGRINHTEQDQGATYWARRNHNSETDRRILDRLPAMLAERERLLADPELARLHAGAVDWHRARIAALRADPDYAALFERITRPDHPDAVAPARPDAPATTANAERYGVVWRSAARARGWHREGSGTAAAFLPGTAPGLVVTFDDQAHARRDGPRMPAFHDAIRSAGAPSVLAFMADTRHFFRDGFTTPLVAELAEAGFFADKGPVLFLGAGMGAFAALATAPLAAGARVLALAPQSTMDRTRVPWETRWGWTADLDWSGPGADAAEGIGAIAAATILTDPWHAPDRDHVARLRAPNVTVLACPFMQGNIAARLLALGLLPSLIRDALGGRRPEPVDFAQALRARRGDPDHLRDLAARAARSGKPGLAAIAERALARPDKGARSVEAAP